MKKTDLALAIYILAAIVFLIVPIPSFLLDILVTFNIAIALLVLLNAMYAQEILSMSSFPTLLLFTTIFRIALNVSSTRLILATGSPGKVVETFGSFVGGGDLNGIAVGLSVSDMPFRIVFGIILIVNTLLFKNKVVTRYNEIFKKD